MKYVAAASYDYGSGKAISYLSRLGWTNASGDSVTRQFARSMLEFVSQSTSNDTIEVCHIVVEGVDGVSPLLDTIDLVSVRREGIEYLSEDNNIDEFDCIIISGYSSSSPLVRGNVLSYISSGGGLIVEDFRITGEIDILQPISPFTVDSVGFNDEGASVWTDNGKLTGFFSEAFLGEKVPLVNSVSEESAGLWTPIIIVDTEAESESGIETELNFLSSDEVDISGEYFMAYYRSIHQNGIIDVDRS